MESLLSLNFDGLVAEAGQFLGYGTKLGLMSATQQEIVRRVIRSGEREAYDPPRHATETSPHSWSFLRPTRVLNVKTDGADYDLPEDYGAMTGELTVVTTTGWYWPIRLVSEGKIRSLRSQGLGSSTGRMSMAAVRPKPMVPGAPQRFEIMFWPKPDSAYGVEYKCLVNPIGISEDNLWPYGGMHFAQTLREAVLAEAELQLDGVYGVHRQQFLERVIAAKQVDKQQSRPEYIGYNGDPSTPEDQLFASRSVFLPDARSTYNGTQY